MRDDLPPNSLQSLIRPSSLGFKATTTTFHNGIRSLLPRPQGQGKLPHQETPLLYLAQQL